MEKAVEQKPKYIRDEEKAGGGYWINLKCRECGKHLDDGQYANICPKCYAEIWKRIEDRARK